MGRKAYTKTQKVQKFLERNAGAKAPEIAKATGVDIQYVYNIVSSSRKLKVGDVAPKKATKGEQLRDLVFGVTKGRGRGRPKLRMQTTPIEVSPTQNPSGIIQGATGAQYTFMDTSPRDMVNSPEHYRVGGIETIDFIEAKGLDKDYYLGNAIKYISRANHKGNRLEDLKKAQWYLNRAVSNFK
jgi:Protein of unknwon function (DUF3310)